MSLLAWIVVTGVWCARSLVLGSRDSHGFKQNNNPGSAQRKFQPTCCARCSPLALRLPARQMVAKSVESVETENAEYSRRGKCLCWFTSSWQHRKSDCRYLRWCPPHTSFTVRVTTHGKRGVNWPLVIPEGRREKLSFCHLNWTFSWENWSGFKRFMIPAADTDFSSLLWQLSRIFLKVKHFLFCQWLAFKGK